MSIEEHNITDLTSQESLYSKFDSIKRLLSEELLDQAKEEILDLHPADLADLIDNSTNEISNLIFSIIREDFKSELLVLLSYKSLIFAVEFFSTKKIADFVSELTAEDAIQFIDQIDDHYSSEILEFLPEEHRLHILEGFNYPEHTAGRVMSKKYILFNEHWTVGQAIDSIRKNDKAPDAFHAGVVVNTKNKPVGTISLCAILKSNRTDLVKDIMNEDLMVSDTNTSLDDLSYTFKHYALTLVPVVNKSGKIVGTVSIENMIYIIEEQAEDAILHLGGVNEIDLYETFLTAAKQRFPWLFINLITACLTSFVINSFGPTIAKMVALASLMPVVASMGGNAGTQTMTVTIMAITNKDIAKINNIKIIAKELLTCGINGFVFAFLGGVIVISLFADMALAKVFSMAVVINFLIAGILGSAIPIILNKFKFDPAPSSGVILAAITDSCGFLIFLGLAKIILMG
jgi:magnesium transporter